MAKSFEFRRHSIKDGPTTQMIGPKGYALARQVGAEQLRGRGFNAFFVSSYFRTSQTFVAFAEGADDFVLKLAPLWPPIYVEREDVWEMWRHCARAERAGIDMVQAVEERDPEFMRALGDEIAVLFLDWAATLDDGVNALIVGHSPHLEFLHLGLSGDAKMPGLRECQGLRVTVEGALWSCDRAAPDLDPSDIRAKLFP